MSFLIARARVYGPFSRWLANCHFYRDMYKKGLKAGWINKMRDKGKNKKRLYLFFINVRLRDKNIMKNK